MISHPRISLESEDLADPTAPVSEGILLSSSVEEVLLVDPLTADEIGDIAESNRADAETVLKRFHDYEQSGRWTTMSPHDRAILLDRFVGVFEEHGDSLAELGTLESGTPTQFSYQLHVAEPLAIMQAGIGASQTSGDGKSIAIIGYHQPLVFAAQTVIKALVEGRPSVIVASPLAPLTVIAFMNFLLEADLPKGVVHMVLGTPSVIELMQASVPDRIVDTAPGGANSCPVPIVIERNSKTAESAITVCRNALLGYSTQPGQRPGVPHLFVSTEEADHYRQAMVEAVNSLVVGNPWDTATEVGPLIRPDEGRSIAEYLVSMQELGATLTQSSRELDSEYFPVPTLIHGLTDPREVMNNTICAPVAAIFEFDDEPKNVS